MNNQHMLADLDPRAGTLERPTLTEDLDKIYFTENTDKFTYIGSTLSSEEKSSFRAFLQQNADLFAWTPVDMPVDNASGFEKLSFMDAYSGYNQIQMHPTDQNKIAFITEYGNYCYKVMPFGLKNAGATYQRLMDKIFAKQIGRNIEVYVDDMVAKTKIGNNPLDDLTEIFRQLRKYNMQLNPKKCAFGVQNGKFLGFMLTSRVPTTIEDYIEWSLYVDGSSNPQGCRAASNNQIAYEALIAGLRLAADLNITELKETDWRSPYIQYLQTGILPGNVENARHFRRQASFFTIYNNCLYRRGFSRPLLKCLCRTEAELALAEAHEEICGTHIGAQSLYSKILRARLYWPTIRQDCQAKVKTNLKIKQHFSSVEHPQTNGLAEAANKVILHALRKNLNDAKGLWAELIPEIIWGYNTTIHSTTKETPFHLVYGSDAMIPVEISQSSLRTELADQTTQDIARQFELDLIEELRSSTAIKHLAMQQHIARRYNQRLHPRSFRTNDLVLRKIEQARRPSSHGKLAANWDGPYRVIEVIGNGAYQLQTLVDKDLPNTWNVSSLKLYYS
ncbi:uncharacterized protein [Arachis hypogaea]|uniref:uncharacterized protein n=1 Tax=Arachis hypogaea TaxID=3818 RepID=UPI003B221A89